MLGKRFVIASVAVLAVAGLVLSEVVGAASVRAGGLCVSAGSSQTSSLSAFPPER